MESNHILETKILIRRLVPAELERALFKAQQDAPALKQLIPGLIDRLHVDLSTVGWVDLGAAAQLVVLIDGWARAIGEIHVVLPTAAMQSGERSDYERGRRAIASRFLRYVRFQSAIEHIQKRRGAKIRILQDGNAVPPDAPGEDFPETYTRIVPLHWISLSNVASRHGLAQHLTHALRSSEEGVDGPDAQALSNVVLYELIQNVVEHAHSGDAALVCGFAHKDVSLAKGTDFLSEELPFLDASATTQQPILEVIVGDSGKGIVPSLESSFKTGPGTLPGNVTKNQRVLPQKVIHWAFDRWSSEKAAGARERGVRGLYRVDRLVAKYFGQISVRTGQTLFVREHLVGSTALERFNRAPQKFAHQPGTFLRIRMNGVSVPGMLELSSRLQSAHREEPSTPLLHSAPARVLAVNNLLESGFDGDTEAALLNSIGHLSERPAALFVLLSAPGNGVRSLENALRFLSAHGNPVPIYAANVRCSIDELESIADSINSECEKNEHGPDGAASRAEQLDPICAVHESGAVRWIGLNKELVGLLQGLGEGEVAPIPAQLLAVVLKAEYRLKTFFVVEPGGTVEPFRQIRCIADLTPFRSHTIATFKQGMEADDAATRQIVWNRGPYLTPTLSFIGRWIRVDLLVDRLAQSSFEALVFELARSVRSAFKPQAASGTEDLRGLLLAVEQRSSLRMRNALEARFGLIRLPHPSDPLNDISATSTRTVPVIVYADMVSSGESVRRTAQTALRQGYAVAAVVALVDTRTSPTEFIEAFGQRIQLITLIHYPNEVEKPSSFSIVGPSLLHAEAHAVTSKDLLKKLRIDRKAEDYYFLSALSFGHAIRPSGRHLTLTIDAAQLLASPNFVDQLKISIESSDLYPTDTDARPVLVLCPFDERDLRWRTAAQAAFASLKLDRPISVEFVARVPVGGTQVLDLLTPLSAKLRGASLVIVFDWGVISGKTIDSLASGAATGGAAKVLVVAANSQLSANEFTFRSSIRRLRVMQSLPSEDDLLAPDRLVDTDVPYQFQVLSRLPLGQYAGPDCPVCAQAGELVLLPCPDNYIADHREVALKRLQGPAEFPAEERVEPDVVKFIAALRALLVSAQITTSSRFVLTQNLVDAAAMLKTSTTVSPLHVALVELLYAEGNWIQLPPIQYRKCRDQVATICLNAVRHGSVDVKAKAISVLRRVSKSAFIKNAPEIFALLSGNQRAMGSLLFGMFTYLARRYHESAQMLSPAIEALNAINDKLVEDRTRAAPVYAGLYDSVQHLRFQSKFLESRARFRGLTMPEAVCRLYEMFSEDNYAAHDAPNTAIEHLLTAQYLAKVRDGLKEEQQTGEESADLQRTLDTWLDIRHKAWDDLRHFLTVSVIPVALAARRTFDSSQFGSRLDEGDAQWFNNLLDTHRNGLAPALVTGDLLQQLQGRRERDKARASSVKVIELMDASFTELSRILRIIVRAKQYEQAHDKNRPAVEPAHLKVFIDETRASLPDALKMAASELKIRHDRVVHAIYAPGTQEKDYNVCCHSRLLGEAVFELMNNIGKHGLTPTNGEANASVECALDEEYVTVTFSNAVRSRRRVLVDPHRHGLEKYGRDISNFGGTLEFSEVESKFVAKLRLSRWRWQ